MKEFSASGQITQTVTFPEYGFDYVRFSRTKKWYRVVNGDLIRCSMKWEHRLEKLYREYREPSKRSEVYEEYQESQRVLTDSERLERYQKAVLKGLRRDINNLDNKKQ